MDGYATDRPRLAIGGRDSSRPFQKGHPMVRLVILALVLGAFAVAIPGCLVTSGKSIEESGVRVTASTLEQIEPGVTTEAWVRATLGEPTAVTVVEGRENVRVLRYDYTVTKSEGGAVFLLFAGGSTSKTTTRSFFEFTDGVVSRCWTEEAS
jgi:outer membrane protein assembly factor BamE (lipoprotein component of BamABCDE complex)